MSNPELHKAADAEEILAGFASRDRGILSQVYEDLFPLIRNMILKNAGQEADALDIFQEAMVIVYEKAVNGEMQIRHSFKSYFYGLCRLQWLMKLRKQKQMPVAFTDVFTDQEDPVELAHNKNSISNTN
ncbi:MAG: sigma factor [Bacteroidota bacterium]